MKHGAAKSFWFWASGSKCRHKGFLSEASKRSRSSYKELHKCSTGIVNPKPQTRHPNPKKTKIPIPDTSLA